MNKGLFITFEGIDGCGKSTQIDLAEKYLCSLGHKCVVTREPGGTRIGESIRKILLSCENAEMCDTAELLLYISARAQHVAEKIVPLVSAGTIVLCDRFQEATFAYQGFGRGLKLDELRSINRFATNGVTPDLTFIFDLTVADAFCRMKKMGKPPDRLEQNKSDFYEKIRNGYLKMASAEPQRIKVIDSSGDIVQTADKVREALTGFFSRVE